MIALGFQTADTSTRLDHTLTVLHWTVALLVLVLLVVIALAFSAWRRNRAEPLSPEDDGEL